MLLKSMQMVVFIIPEIEGINTLKISIKND